MSSLAYGIVNAKRAAAPAGESQTTAAPAMKTYIDTLAALVPAEALVFYSGIVVPNVTRSVPVAGKKATAISDPGLMGWSCAGLLVFSAALYVVGRFRRDAKLTRWDVLKTLIPPAAFAAWMLLESPSVWDVWWRGSSTAERVVITAFAAVVLGILATALGYQVDQAQGTPADEAAEPASGSAPGGVTGPPAVDSGTVTARDPAVSRDTQPAAAGPPASAADASPVTVAPQEGASVAPVPAQPPRPAGGSDFLGSV